MTKMIKVARDVGYKYVDTILPLVEWVYENRKTLALSENDTDEHPYFDYPDYCGMPKSLSRKMSSDICDLIQDNLPAFEDMTPRQIMLFFLRAD